MTARREPVVSNGNGNGNWNAHAFDEFWARYPRKVGKKAARKEWDKAHVTPELFEQIQRTLEWEIAQWDDPQFIPHPRTWLCQGRWDDEPVQAKPMLSKKTHVTLSAAAGIMREKP
jgi:hypothetical protein